MNCYKASFKGIVFLAFSGLFFQANATDLENGAALHQDECIRCHDASAYTRTDRKVQSLANLGTQVRMCKDNLGITWFDDEVDDVISFLNHHYYHF